MATRTTYGLAPCVWRRLRARHGGGEIALYGRAGEIAAYAYLYRYESKVAISEAVPFGSISWRQTIEKTVAQPGLLQPSIIPIGVSRL